ncbi:MAG TPA: hypothetical protein VF651_04040 [Gammaproteobacteria bacterium]
MASLLAALAGCGSPDYAAGDVTVQPSPAGYYSGELVYGAHTGQAVALVSKTGEVRIVETATGRELIADLPDSSSGWQTSLEGYAALGGALPGGASHCQGALDGDAVAAANLFAEYSCGSLEGFFSLDYDDAVSFDPPDVAKLTGIMQGSLPGHGILLLTVDFDGSYSGTDTDGCSYEGTFTAADPIINLYEMQLTRRCGGATLQLAGLASLDTVHGRLYFGVSDMDDSLAGVLVYQ